MMNCDNYRLVLIGLQYFQEAQRCTPINYPKPDGVISFDIPTSLYRYSPYLSLSVCVCVYFFGGGGGI